MSETYGPTLIQIPERKLQEWAVMLRDIIEPEVRFKNDFREMQREALVEAARIAQSMLAQLSEYM